MRFSKNFTVDNVVVGQTFSVEADRHHWWLRYDLKYGIDNTAIEFAILLGAKHTHPVTQFK